MSAAADFVYDFFALVFICKANNTFNYMHGVVSMKLLTRLIYLFTFAEMMMIITIPSLL